MPRIPRGSTIHSVYHVTARGVERRSIFATDIDRRYFLKKMRVSFQKHRVSLYAYCLMPNHIHLLLQTTDIPLEIPMHELLLKHALNFNHHQARVGHLFQSRFHSKPCLDLGHLINIITYILLNPVRASLAPDPGSWRWSSHREFVDAEGSHLNLASLESLTGMTLEELRRVYFERVGGRWPPPHDVESVLREAAASVGIDTSELRSGRKGGVYTAAKRTAIRLAEEAGLSLKELSKALSCTCSALRHLRESVS